MKKQDGSGNKSHFCSSTCLFDLTLTCSSTKSRKNQPNMPYQEISAAPIGVTSVAPTTVIGGAMAPFATTPWGGSYFASAVAFEETFLTLLDEVDEIQSDVSYLLDNALTLDQDYIDVSNIHCPQRVSFTDYCGC